MSDREFEPLTGNWSKLDEKGTHYQEIGYAIIRSVAALKKLQDTGDMVSKAVDKVRDTAGDVHDDITKASDRYTHTAAALITYSSKLKAAQELADTAIEALNTAQCALDDAKTDEKNAKDKAETCSDEDQKASDTAVEDAGTAVTTASTRVTNAQDDWRTARTKKNTAAGEAITAIKVVTEGRLVHDLKDSRWDKIKHVAGKIVEVVKVICEIAGVLAIFLSWVPVLGAILVGLAILGAVITLVESIVNLWHGGSWTDVLFAVVGVALACFGGKIATYLGKLAKFKAVTKLNKFQFTSAGFKLTKTKTLKGLGGTFKHGQSQGFKTMMKEIRNPFDLKLGEGAKFSEKFLSGLKSGWGDFKGNPLGLKLGDGDTLAAFKNLDWGVNKVGLIVADGRTVLSKGQGLWNAGDDMFGGGQHQIEIKPEGVLKAGGNAIESRIRG
ncbi:putative T7SS-secreted protein [Schumannella sp. 10F1B-5-1]|uniref:putative T7SS-secreted protein n=1 Tax=Schumannella sp. 10F1B-5-1 TaxID=2590780 RepID=UPI001132225F|nr:hypothetical protein [Schumannella sp. 10F1B-5-1]TPW72259.1 hypothetical protein FJ658_08275 [Schumannella sp. 10F1B-5-1]